MKRNLLLFPTLLLIIPSLLHAQGEWAPPDALFTRPRLLLQPTDLSRLRVRVAEEPFLGVYGSIWEYVQNAESPIDTISSASRRENARLAKNLSFVLLVDMKVESGAIAELTPGERDSLESRLTGALSRINPDIDQEEPATWSERSLELIDYLAAWDMAQAIESPLTAAAGQKLAMFAGRLHRAILTPTSGPAPIAGMHDHHGLIICGALGTAAIVLNDMGNPDADFQPSSWINTALWWSDSHLWRSDERLSDRNAMVGFAEGPGHMRDAFRSLLPFYRSLARVWSVDSIEVTAYDPARTIANPFFDSAFDSLYTWVTSILDPAGTLPMIEETHAGTGFPELALTGRSQYVRPIRFRGYRLEQFLSPYGSINDMRAEFIAAGTPPTDPGEHPLSTFLPDAGNIIFRGHEPDSWTLGLLAEHGSARSAGGGYDQGDAGNFYVVLGDQPLSYDPGVGSNDGTERFADATDHNLVLVDGKGPMGGADGESRDSDAEVEEFWSLRPPFQEIGSGSLNFSYARIRTGYEGATITRHAMMIDGAYVVVADDITASEPHVYTWQLHGYMPVAILDTIAGGFELFEDEREAAWSNGTEGLAAHVAVSSESEYSSRGAAHEIFPGYPGPHMALTVTNIEPTRSMQFVAGITPRMRSNSLMYDSRTGNGSATLVSRAGGPHDLFSLSGDTLRRTISGADSWLGYDIETDARFVGGHFSPFGEMPRFLVMTQGTELTVDEQQAISADHRLDVMVANNIVYQDLEYPAGGGYVSDSGTVWFRMDWLNYADYVFGDNVEDFTFLWATNRVAVRFSHAGYFWWSQSDGVPDEHVSENPDARLETKIRHVSVLDKRLEITLDGTPLSGSKLLLYAVNGDLIASRPLTIADGTMINLYVEGLYSGNLLLVLERDGKVRDVTSFGLLKR